MKYRYSRYTDIGKRGLNEDDSNIVMWDHSLLAVVADGLGGHLNGEIASRTAVDSILQALQEKDTDEDVLAYAIIAASSDIQKAAPSGYSTAAVLWIQDDYAVAAHIGDSRIYQFRDGQIIFQSTDHSVVQTAVWAGALKPEDVRKHKDRNKLFRVLGDGKDVPRVDSTELTVMPGDRFLLCTDGFWEPVTEKDMIASAFAFPDPDDWLNAMRHIIDAAQDQCQDNHTAITIVVQ